LGTTCFYVDLETIVNIMTYHIDLIYHFLGCKSENL